MSTQALDGVGDSQLDLNKPKTSDVNVDKIVSGNDSLSTQLNDFQNSFNDVNSSFSCTQVKSEVSDKMLKNQNLPAENSEVVSNAESGITDTPSFKTSDDDEAKSIVDNVSIVISQQTPPKHVNESCLGNEDNLTSSIEINSSDTDTCSDEENSNETIDEIENVWNNISYALTQIHKDKLKAYQKGCNIVSGFKLNDGSCININEKYLLEPIAVEIGSIVNAFLNKVKIMPEFSDMLHKTQVPESVPFAKSVTIEDLQKKCKQYEKNNVNLKLQLQELQEKLQAHDQSAKNTINKLQNDYNVKLNELSKKCTLAENEKQSSVMNFARREKELLDLKKQKEKAEQYAKGAGKEKEKALLQLKQLKLDLSKLKNSYDKKETENAAQTKELEKLKEEINSQAIKVRWAQNKLKSEIDNHKETKEKCEKMQLVIQQAKEETEQIRKNCQDMIKTYQESEEIKSNALDIELKEKKEYISKLEKNLKDSQSNLEIKIKEIKLIEEKYDNLHAENETLTEQISNLNLEKSKSEHVMHNYEEVVNKQKATASQMNEKMQEIFDLESKIENLNNTIENLNDALHEAVVRRDAAFNDIAFKEKKEQELLEFTQKVSSKNTELAVEIEQLNTRLASQEADLSHSAKLVDSLQEQVKELTTLKEKSDQALTKNQTSLNDRLEEKERTICQLLLQLEELKDELRTVKRKNAASQKDLIRQLNQVKKKADNAEAVSSSSISNSLNHSADGGSMGSRTSSVTSLDRIHAPAVGDSQISHSCELISVPETTVAGPDTLDRQMLIERIVRLQQIHAKKNEKIDFLNEHVHQLVSSLQKKQRLIQHYIMREESGALAPPREHHDQKRHGLTLELSIEINQKMQSVLEDTLLKNITLKESLETMGYEVQRLQSLKTTQ